MGMIRFILCSKDTPLTLTRHICFIRYIIFAYCQVRVRPKKKTSNDNDFALTWNWAIRILSLSHFVMRELRVVITLALFGHWPEKNYGSNQSRIVFKMIMLNMFVTLAKLRVTISAVDNAMVVVFCLFWYHYFYIFYQARNEAVIWFCRKIARTNTNMFVMPKYVRATSQEHISCSYLCPSQ